MHDDDHDLSEERIHALTVRPHEFPPLPGAIEAAERHVPSSAFSPIGTRSELPAAAGLGYRDTFALSTDLQGLYSRFRPAKDSMARAVGLDLMKVHFKLNGRNTVKFDGQDDFAIPDRCVLVVIHPQELGKFDCHRGGVMEHSLTLACRRGVLTQALGLDPESLPPALRAFASEHDSGLFVKVLPLTGRIARVIEEMTAPPYGGWLRHVHTEARAMDLICMVMDMLVHTEQPSQPRLTPRDVRALEGVRDVLSNQFTCPPTLPELASQAGMNRSKLTQGFRWVFNESVHDYCLRLRMQLARELLLKGERVGVVSVAVGYAHQSSFANVFREYFGFSPLALRATARPSRGAP
jgi:AraC-like DNA-binding protein